MLLTDPRTNGTTATELSIFWNPTRYLENQVAVMTSPNVTTRAAEILGEPYTSDDVADAVTVRSENNIDALSVTATSNDASQPIPITNAVVQAYGEVVSEEVIKNAEDTVSNLAAVQGCAHEQPRWPRRPAGGRSRQHRAPGGGPVDP